jgi:hypothetical protein
VLSDPDEKAFREVLADVKNETQQSSGVVPGVAAQDIERQINEIDRGAFRQIGPANVVRAYQALAAPLDKLILELQAAASRMQRQDVVKLPDLDEAPLPYRSAVSDYFEAMSRDYHPDDADADAKKP